jgi:hypothetical protein
LSASIPIQPGPMLRPKQSSPAYDGAVKKTIDPATIIPYQPEFCIKIHLRSRTNVLFTLRLHWQSPNPRPATEPGIGRGQSAGKTGDIPLSQERTSLWSSTEPVELVVPGIVAGIKRHPLTKRLPEGTTAGRIVARRGHGRQPTFDPRTSWNGASSLCE